jgi:type I restriction enzyme S subunit
MLPTDWTVKKVREICETVTVGIVIQPATLYTEDKNGIKAFRSANIRENRINNSDWVYLTNSANEANTKSQLREGDVVIVRSGAPGTACVIPSEYAGCNCIDVIIARPISEIILPDYLCYFTNSDIAKRLISSASGGLALQHLNVSAYSRLDVPIPPLEAQREVVAMINAWNVAIEKTERLLATKEKRFSWLIKSQISDKCDSWEHLRTDKIFKSISDKVHNGEELLSVTQDRGVIPRSMLEGRVMSPEGSTDSYKLIKVGDFAISLRSFQGGIEYSRYQGLISPAYTVLRPKLKLHDEFFRYFFKSYLFIKKYLNIAVIGIRDGKQISIPDFMTVKIPLPPLDRQQQIASILNLAQEEIDLLKKLADAYRKQKRGLMQKLLSGEWRVKTDEPGVNP